MKAAFLAFLAWKVMIRMHHFQDHFGLTLGDLTAKQFLWQQ